MYYGVPTLNKVIVLLLSMKIFVGNLLLVGQYISQVFTYVKVTLNTICKAVVIVFWMTTIT